MAWSSWAVLSLFFFVPGGKADENPWKAKVAPAVEAARREQSPGAYRTALETAWKADDWQTGLELAREALDSRPDAPELHGPAARAFWRAGRIHAAEAVAARLPLRTRDRVALAVLITIELARGNEQRALAAADQLAALPDLRAEDLYYIVAARAVANRLAELSPLIRRAEQLSDPAHGYPEIYIREQLEGFADFLDAIGPEPVNQIATYGSAAMPVVPLINLPGCEAYINGRGPYRLIVDTGGSITLSLDAEIADDLGLRSVASSTVHGVGGKDVSGQVLVDELRIGGITCRRVMTRTFGVRKSIAFAADGIIGTGLFQDARMTMDFQHGRLTLAPAASRPASGREVEVRIIGDAKLIAPLQLNGEPAAALLDSGADACAVAPSRLRRLFPGRKIRTLPAFAIGVGGGQNPSITLTPGVTFTLAGKTYENYGGLGLDVLDTLLGPLLGLQSDLLLGMPVMREMKTLTVDYPHCRMWVEWLETE